MARRHRGGRGRRRGNGRTGTAVAAAGVTLLAAAVAGGFGWLFWQANTQTVLDKETGCPASGPKAVTAILLDTTDPVSRTTLSDLRNQFDRTVSDLPVGGYLQIYALTWEPGKLETLFEGCNPGDGSTVNQWTNNPRLRQRKWEEAFRAPLDKVSEGIGQGGNADMSPIMAGIQKISLSLFDAPMSDGVPKRLVVASDMTEHTPLFSEYRSGPDFAAFRKSEANGKYRTSLDGVEVSILYIDRKAARFGIKRQGDFWYDWVKFCHGRFQDMTRLEGLNP